MSPSLQQEVNKQAVGTAASREHWGSPWNTEYVPIWGIEEKQDISAPMESRTRNQLATVNKCPVEVLREIFIHSLPQWDRSTDESNWTGTGPLSSRNRNAPILMASVCADWREIFLASGSSGFWTKPCLYIPYNTSPVKRWAQLELLALWLKRSNGKKLWLNIFVKCHSHEGGALSNIYNHFKNHLGPEMHRVAHLKLDISHNGNLQYFFFGRYALPALEELLLGEASAALDLKNMTALKTLSFRAPTALDPFQFRCSTWYNLKQLHVDTSDWKKWRQIIQECPNLRHASVTFSSVDLVGMFSDSGLAAQPNRRIEFRHLESLQMQSFGQHSISKIVEDIYFPALSSLEIHTVLSGVHAFQWVNSGHFLGQIGSLRRLVYHGTLVNLIAMIKYTPLLSALDFTVAGEDVQPVLEALQQPQEVTVVPVLETLRIAFDKSAEGKAPIWTIIEMIKSRSRTGTPLKRFDLGVSSALIRSHIQFLFGQLGSDKDLPECTCSHVPQPNKVF